MGNACTEGLKLLFDPDQHQLVQEPSYIFHARSKIASAITCDLARTNSNSKLLAAYTIAGVLGEGTYGTVRRSTSLASGGPRALKSVHKRGTPRALLVLEVGNQSMCQHPNIVQVLKVYETPSWVHMVFEACEGGDLYTLLARRERLEEVEVALVVRQVLSSLHYLHRTVCIAHRDIKLENVLLAYKDAALADNVVKVTDFGLSKAFARGGRRLLTVCGTDEYMAPEMSRGPYTETCDVWSCGVLLCVLISGGYPTWSSRGVLMLEERAAGVWNSASSEVKALLQRLCCGDPEKRWSAEEALVAAWVQQQPEEALGAAWVQQQPEEAKAYNTPSTTMSHEFRETQSTASSTAPERTVEEASLERKREIHAEDSGSDAPFLTPRSFPGSFACAEEGLPP